MCSVSSPAHGGSGCVRSSGPQGECHLSGPLAPHLGPGRSPRAGSRLSVTCGMQSHGGTVRGVAGSPCPSSHPVSSLLPPSPADRWVVGQVRTVKRALTLKNQSCEDQSSRGDEATEYLRRQSPHGPLLFRVPKVQGSAGTPHSRQRRPHISQEKKVSASRLETLKLETWGPRC